MLSPCTCTWLLLWQRIAFLFLAIPISSATLLTVRLAAINRTMLDGNLLISGFRQARRKMVRHSSSTNTANTSCTIPTTLKNSASNRGTGHWRLHTPAVYFLLEKSVVKAPLAKGKGQLSSMSNASFPLNALQAWVKEEVPTDPNNIGNDLAVDLLRESKGKTEANGLLATLQLQAEVKLPSISSPQGNHRFILLRKAWPNMLATVVYITAQCDTSSSHTSRHRGAGINTGSDAKGLVSASVLLRLTNTLCALPNTQGR
mmetsp:Transcript_4813/g.7670  ORF Transcript_4813/g.7670 Transcript_4813/m.7670 type:complete len:259 (-) Transcript_4813:354-1130(-)